MGKKIFLKEGDVIRNENGDDTLHIDSVTFKSTVVQSILGPVLYIAKNLFSTLADVMKVGQHAWVNLHVPTKTGRC